MKERQQQDRKTQKKPYVKPEIQQVQLRPEEAVLGYCKVSSGGGSGPLQATCSTVPICGNLGS
jgi:hypothetical protein